jgi:S1-C subfamily serine protease
MTPLEEFVWAGIAVEAFNAAGAAALGLPPNVTGVKVDVVQRGSRGDRGGVMSGDLICEVNGTQIYDVDSFSNLVTAQGLTGGVLLINRSARSMYVTVPER